MAPLTTKQRDKLPRSAFAKPKSRDYPIDTPERARSALARAKANEGPSGVGEVKKAVEKKYPKMRVK